MWHIYRDPLCTRREPYIRSDAVGRDMSYAVRLYKLSHLCTPRSQEFGDAPVLRNRTGGYGLFLEPCSSSGSGCNSGTCSPVTGDASDVPSPFSRPRQLSAPCRSSQLLILPRYCTNMGAWAAPSHHICLAADPGASASSRLFRCFLSVVT